MVEVDVYGSNFNVLESFIRENPLLEPRTVYAEMLKKYQRFKKKDVNKLIQQIRGEIFPKDSEKILNAYYCQATDTSDPNYNLFRAHIKLPYFTTDTTNVSIKNQEFIILANKTMLKQLSLSSQWFIDGTFKVAPKGYTQILNILVYLPHLSIFYPACQVFMTHKTEELYFMVLLTLKNICHQAKLRLEPRTIMADFEKALQNAIKISFPEAELCGCYFHFVKCLYDKITKLGLRKKEFKNQSRVMISYLQILVHCEEDKRKELFKELKTIFKNDDKRFTQFLDYFSKNWLTHSFMDNLFQALQDESSFALLGSTILLKFSMDFLVF